tara:strand:+ start:53 stop:1027 length:975 start_codon:yes stop_codon:yes gene_type:complete
MPAPSPNSFFGFGQRPRVADYFDLPQPIEEVQVDDDPYAELAGIDPLYDAWKAQQKMAKQQDHMALRNIDPTTDEGSNGLLRILGRNPELYNRPEIKGLVGIAQTAQQKRDMLEQRKAALKAQTDMQQAQLDRKKALDEAKMAEVEAKKSQAAKLRDLYLLNPKHPEYDKRYEDAVGRLEDDDFSNPSIQAVLKSHEPHRFAPKPDRIPEAVRKEHLAAYQEATQEPEDLDKEMEFEARFGRKPKTKEEWSQAYYLVKNPRLNKLKAITSYMDAIKNGAPLPVDQAPPAEQAPAIPVVNSPADAMKLPRGTVFQTPDGKMKRVP